jgi:hypothetical protein
MTGKTFRRRSKTLLLPGCLPLLDLLASTDSTLGAGLARFELLQGHSEVSHQRPTTLRRFRRIGARFRSRGASKLLKDLVQKGSRLFRRGLLFS